MRREAGGGGGRAVSVRAFLDSESRRLTSSPSSLIFRDVVLSTRQRRYTFSCVPQKREGEGGGERDALGGRRMQV